MKKRESKLWQRIKKHITKPHFIRIESNTINGIPDINGCWSGKEFWMELKSDKVSYPKLSKWQIAWINKRILNGGIVLICNETLLEKKLKLYRPLSAIRDARLLKPAFAFSFPVNGQRSRQPFKSSCSWMQLKLVLVPVKTNNG